MRKKTYEIKDNVVDEDLKHDRRKPHKKEAKKIKVVRIRDIRDNMIINEDGTIQMSDMIFGEYYSFKIKITNNFLILLDKVKRLGNSSLPANLKSIQYVNSYPAGGGMIIYGIGIKEDFKRGKNSKGQGRLLTMVLAVDTKTMQAICYSPKRDYIFAELICYFLCQDTIEEFDDDFNLLMEKIDIIKRIREEKFKSKKDQDLRDWKK